MELLVDGNHLAARCRYSKVADLCTSDGRPSGVVYGFLKGLAFTAGELRASASQTTVVWDGGKARRRLELFPEYKSGRVPENPSDQQRAEQLAYVNQIRALRWGLATLGCRSIRIRGTEADDWISVLAHSTPRPVVIFSGDKDFHQLVSPRISIYDSRRGWLSHTDVLSQWEVDSADKILRLRAIVGDSADAIAGVRSVGIKRARLVVNGPANLSDQKAIKQADHWGEVVSKQHDLVLRNLELMRLPRDLGQTPYDGAECYEFVQQSRHSRRRDLRAFVAFCREWELQSLLEEMRF